MMTFCQNRLEMGKVALFYQLLQTH